MLQCFSGLNIAGKAFCSQKFPPPPSPPTVPRWHVGSWSTMCPLAKRLKIHSGTLRRFRVPFLLKCILSNDANDNLHANSPSWSHQITVPEVPNERPNGAWLLIRGFVNRPCKARPNRLSNSRLGFHQTTYQKPYPIRCLASQIPIPRCPNNCKIAQSQRINRRGWADRRQLEHKQVCYQQKNNKVKNILFQNAHEVEQKSPLSFAVARETFIFVALFLTSQGSCFSVLSSVWLSVCKSLRQ